MAFPLTDASLYVFEWRKHQNDDFFALPKAWLKAFKKFAGRGATTACKILAYIVSRHRPIRLRKGSEDDPKNWGKQFAEDYWRINFAEAAEECGCCEDTVKAHVALMQKKGYLTRFTVPRVTGGSATYITPIYAEINGLTDAAKAEKRAAQRAKLEAKKAALAVEEEAIAGPPAPEVKPPDVYSMSSAEREVYRAEKRVRQQAEEEAAYKAEAEAKKAEDEAAEEQAAEAIREEAKCIDQAGLDLLHDSPVRAIQEMIKAISPSLSRLRERIRDRELWMRSHIALAWQYFCGGDLSYLDVIQSFSKGESPKYVIALIAQVGCLRSWRARDYGDATRHSRECEHLGGLFRNYDKLKTEAQKMFSSKELQERIAWEAGGRI